MLPLLILPTPSGEIAVDPAAVQAVREELGQTDRCRVILAAAQVIVAQPYPATVAAVNAARNPATP